MNWSWLIALLTACIITALVESWRWQRGIRLLEADRDQWRRRCEAITRELKGYYNAVKYEPGYVMCYSVAREIERMVKSADDAVKEATDERT
jgi:hypothetical protein